MLLQIRVFDKFLLQRVVLFFKICDLELELEPEIVFVFIFVTKTTSGSHLLQNA